MKRMMIIGMVSVAVCAGIVCTTIAEEKTDVKKTPQSINALIWELAKDGTFSKADAESVALEVARRLWWPESNKAVVSSATEKDGTWAVRVEDRKGSPADPGCEIIVSRHWLISARFLPGE
jgi:hypothetical protein